MAARGLLLSPGQSRFSGLSLLKRDRSRQVVSHRQQAPFPDRSKCASLTATGHDRVGQELWPSPWLVSGRHHHCRNVST